MAAVSASTPIRVLVVDDEESQRTALATMVSAWGFQAQTAADGEDALEQLATFPAQILITDLKMPGMDGAELLRRLAHQDNTPVSIVVTAFGDIRTAVSTIHDLGAFWFLEKPIDATVLRVLLERAGAQSRLKEKAERLHRQLAYQGVLGDLVGPSPGMQEVFSLIRQVAPSKAAVLVTGDSGTGKELVARAIHNLSPRLNGPFIAINCAAMPETLMESELFGHEKGAFTGALERRAGCIELAHAGTLLLDELAEMPIGTQAKLLRVLEDSRVRRLGGKKEMEVDVRFIASTNNTPEEAIRKEKLREDLYYRLNVFHIHLPPLRERREDIPAIADALVRNLSEKHGCEVTGISTEALDLLHRHLWPGNVRELRNVLERAVIVAGTGPVLPRHLPRAIVGAATLIPARPPEDAESLPLRVGITVDEAERALIELTLRHTKNNKTRAAEILGISLKTLHNKLKEYGAAEASTAD